MWVCVTALAGEGAQGAGRGSGKDLGSRLLQSGVLAGKQGYLAETARKAPLAVGTPPAQARKEPQVCVSLESRLKWGVIIGEREGPDPKAACGPHGGTWALPQGITETGFR